MSDGIRFGMWIPRLESNSKRMLWMLWWCWPWASQIYQKLLFPPRLAIMLLRTLKKTRKNKDEKYWKFFLFSTTIALRKTEFKNLFLKFEEKLPSMLGFGVNSLRTVKKTDWNLCDITKWHHKNTNYLFDVKYFSKNDWRQ